MAVPNKNQEEKGTPMNRSTCTISFFKNDLLGTRLKQGKCPVRNCSMNVRDHKVPFIRYRGKMRYMPYCPEHGIRLHKEGFVYYNGPSKQDLAISTRRNLAFNADYYLDHFLTASNKVESSRLCYENSEDAVTYNAFTEMLSRNESLRSLVGHIVKTRIDQTVKLYLWGGEIDISKSRFNLYEPLKEVRKQLEPDIKQFVTEPDIMLIVPGKILICIEAKFGSKNPIAKDRPVKEGEKPKSMAALIERYCDGNKLIDAESIFNFSNKKGCFYEQLFRNLVFAASMAKLAHIERWFVVNLRSQHVMNIRRGKSESLPVVRAVHSILKPQYKKRFSHVMWEEIYGICVKRNQDLYDLSWYMKNKTLNCRRAFSIS
jgi:hypothetical protein